MVQSAGEGMQLFGEALLSMGILAKKRENEARLTDLEVQVSRGATDLLSKLHESKFEDLKPLDGSDRGREAINDFLQSKKEEASAISTWNPSLGQAYKALLAKSEIHLSNAYTQIHDKKFNEYDLGLLQETLKMNADAYQRASSDEERMAIITRGNEEINQRSGISIHPQQAFMEKQKWSESTHKDYVLSKLERYPMVLTGEINNVDKFLAEMLDPVKHPYLTQHTVNEIITKAKGLRKEQVTSMAYDSLYKTFKGDTVMMGAYLNDPENRKAMGLGMEEADYVRGAISRADADRKQLQAAVYDKTATEMFLNLKGMTPRKIDDAVRSGKLDYKLGEHFKQQLKSVGEGTTDPATYDRFLQLIYRGDVPPDQVRAQIFGSRGLSRADKEKFLNKTESNIEKQDARNLERARKYLAETVKPSGTMITQAKPEEAYNYLKAVDAMEDAVLKARANGKPLTNRQVIETAQEISQTFKMTTREQMEAARRNMERDLRGGRPADNPIARGKPMDDKTAASIFLEAGRDPKKAAKIARDRGYSF